MALAKLSIDLEAKLASFDADLKRAAASAEQAGNQFASAFGLAKSALGGFVGAFSIGVLVDFFKTTAQGVDNLNDLADATGASVQNLSALENMAARTGTSFEVVGDALVKLNKALGEAVPGSTQEAAFKALGLSVKDLRALDPVEALQQVARALGGFADDSGKARFEQELFGKSLRTVAPLLNDLAAAGRLNATVTEEQAKQAEIFSHHMADLAKNTTDTARAIVGSLLPAANSLLEAFKKKDITPFAKAFGLDELSSGLTQAVAAYKLLSLAAQRADLKKALEADPNNTGILRRLQEIDVEAKSLAGNFKDAREAYLGIDKVSKAGAGRGLVFPPFVDGRVSLGDPKAAAEAAKKAAEESKRLAQEAARADNQYRRLAQSIGLTIAGNVAEATTGEKLSATAEQRLKTLQELSAGQYGYSQSVRSSVLAMLDAAEISDVTAVARKQEAEALLFLTNQSRQYAEARTREAASQDAIAEGLQQQVKEYGLTADAIERLRIARLRDQAEGERALAALGEITDETVDETNARIALAVALERQISLRQKLADLDNTDRKDPLKGAKDALDEYLLRVRDIGTDTRSAVGRGLSLLEEDITRSLATGKGGIKEFVDFAKAEFIRLNLVRPGIAAISSGGGDLLRSFAAAFGFKGLFAKGGTLGAGNWGIAGEAGPEIVRGPATIQPLRGAGGMSIDASVTIGSVGAGTSRAEVFAAVRAAQAQTLAQFRRLQMQGAA